MKLRTAVALILVFAMGIAVGVFARKEDSMLYRGKSKEEAARGLLQLAKKQAGKGTWERIAVGRVYYLAGMKAEGQAIFDEILSRKPESSDIFRIARVYYEAGEWDKAKPMFDDYLKKNAKDDKAFAEVGAYYNLKGDRAAAEEMFDKSLRLESEVWATVNMASSYLGVPPQQ